MEKHGKMKGGSALLVVVMVLVGAAASLFVYDNLSTKGWVGGTLSQGGTGSGSDATLSAGDNCGTDKSTTATLTLWNQLNDTARESFDADYALYTSSGTLFSTGSDTTAGSVSNLNCGQEYVLRLTSTDAAAGDNAQVFKVRAGNAQIIENGRAVLFKADARNVNIEIDGKQSAYLQARVFDNINAAFLTDNSGDGSTADYETDGTAFRSTSSNTTAIAVSTGGRLDTTWNLQSTRPAGDFADFGVLVAIDAAPDKWDRPSVTFEGATLTDVKGQLDAKTATALANYEYVYAINSASSGATFDQRTDKKLGVRIAALSGIDPGASDDVAVDFVAIGATRETAGNAIRYSAYTDAASPAAVRAVQDFDIDVQ